MNIIMTGATSFVGAATVRELLRRGHTVTAIARPASSKLGTILDGNEEALLSGRLLVTENDLSEPEQLLEKVTKPQDVQKAFRCVYKSLRPGGLFVFDINTLYKLENLDGQVFLDETEDSYCVWRAVYDKRHSLCRYGMDLFQRLEDDTWERSFEEHIERAYTPEELSGWLTEAGLAQIEQFGNLRLEAPENTELRIFFAAKKG